MKRVSAYRAFLRAQSGASLIVLAVILVLGTLGVLLSALNVATSNTTAAQRARSGRALAEAKLALLGYAATQASADDYPGRLPCPEAAGDYGNAANEGRASGFCTLPAVGRLPWRTLGLSKLTDGYGEPLWYVVSPGFALPSSTAPVSINSNTAAQLTLDGASAAAVALIIAPGAPMNVQPATGCTARAQSRSNPPPDLRDYLECENATLPADATFVTTGPSTSFNDQVVRVTHAELFDAVEPVVAKRIETQIAPALKTVYLGTDWGLPAVPPPPATPVNYIYPYAVTFADPTTSTFLGANGETEGLLPLFTMATDPTRVVWYAGSSSKKPAVIQISGAGTIISSNCSASTTTTASCSVTYTGKPHIQIRAWARRVARAMRKLNPAAVPLTWADPLDPSISVTASFITGSSADAYVYVQANLPNVTGSTTTTVTVPIGVLADHPLTDPNDATLGWFVKNKWHHLVYYAFAPNYAANQTYSCNDDAPPASSGANFCLTVKTVNDPMPAGKQRAILVMTGRAVTTQGLPSGALRTQTRLTGTDRGDLANYFEDAENSNGDKVFVQDSISKTPSNTFNDRVIIVDSNP